MKKNKLHYSIIIFFILSIFIGLFKEFLFIFLFLVLHDLGHLFIINLFKLNINKIVFYPFGGIINYEFKNDFLYKEILISFGGVLVNFLLMLLFYFLNIEMFYLINLMFLVINLLPIYPLDGGKITQYVLMNFLPFKLSKKISYISSIILAIVLFISIYKVYQAYIVIFFMCFVLKSNITSLVNLKEEYNNYIVIKHLNFNDILPIKRSKRYSNDPINNLFYGKNLVFDYDSFTLDEKSVLDKLYKK